LSLLKAGGGRWYKLSGHSSPEEAPRPDYAAYVFAIPDSIIIFQVQKLTLSD